MKKIALGLAASVFFLGTFLSLAVMVPSLVVAQAITPTQPSNGLTPTDPITGLPVFTNSGSTAGTSMSGGSAGTTTTGATAGTTMTGGSAGTTPAQTNTADPTLSFQVPNPLGSSNTTLNTFIANVLGAVVLLLTPVITIMLLYSGFLFVTAQGEPEKLTKAKQALMYTLIGAAIVLGAQGLSLVIKNTVTCLATTGSC